MIVLTCRCIPAPGQEDEARAAAMELTEKSQDHQGLLGYFWSLDEGTPDLHLVEVHENEASVLNHIARSDVSRLAAAGSFADIKVFGDAPSPALLETLSGFGGYQLFRSLQG
jgi:quinol monooxygenase YgiN